MSENYTITTLTPENIGAHGIVCVRGKKYQHAIDTKKTWLKARMAKGLKYYVLNVDGRDWGMLEAIPAEHAWRPVDAPGWWFIHCIWVIGSQKGKGFGRMLVEKLIHEVQDSQGICVLTTKRPFAAEKKFYEALGFEQVRKVKPYFELMAYRIQKDAPLPAINVNPETVKKLADGAQLDIQYTHQCPYVIHWLKVFEDALSNRGFGVDTQHLQSREQVLASNNPFASFGVFAEQNMLTHHPNTEKAIDRMLEKLQD